MWPSSWPASKGHLRTFAPKSSHAQIFFLNLPCIKVMIYYCQKAKKIWGHWLRFGENMPLNGENMPLNLKNWALLDDKATVSVSPKILQLDIWFEMIVFCQLVRFLKNKFEFSDHSFMHLVVARWQDSMSRGQKFWNFLTFHAQFLFIFGQCVDHCK